MPRALLTMATFVLSAVAGCSADRDAAPTSGEPTASAGAGSAPTVIGMQWQWVGTTTPVERVTVADPSRYTMRLVDDGKAEMQFDCNRGSGSYSIAEHEISFGPFMSTRMACPEESQDFVFMSQLEKVSSYFVRDGDLYLEMPYDSGTMHFHPAANLD